MQYCPKCQIRIRGDKRCCPLCQGSLTGTPEDPAYPVIAHRGTPVLTVFKVALFAGIALSIIMFLLYLLSEREYGWTLIIILFTAVALADVWLVLYTHGNPVKLVTFQSWVLAGILTLVDVMTGAHNWAIHWAVPVISLLVIPLTFLVGPLSRLALADYIIYLISDVLLTDLQIIPYLTGENRFPIPAFIAMGAVTIFGAALVIFRTRDLTRAAEKWFNL